MQDGLATCDLASVQAGEGVDLSVVVRSAVAGTFSAHAQVVNAGDTSHSNDAAAGTLRVQSADSSPSAPATQAPARSGGGALDVTLLGMLGALLGMGARRFSPRAAAR